MIERGGQGEVTEKRMGRQRQRRVKMARVAEARRLVCLGPEAQGSWERLGSGCSRGRGAGLGKAVGGRPRDPGGGRRRPRDRMPGSSRRLPPPPRAASWGAGPAAWVPPAPRPPASHSASCSLNPTPPRHQPPTPAGASARAPPARPLIVQPQRRRPLPQPLGASCLPPHLPRSLRPRTEAAPLLSDP